MHATTTTGVRTMAKGHSKGPANPKGRADDDDFESPEHKPDEDNGPEDVQLTDGEDLHPPMPDLGDDARREP